MSAPGIDEKSARVRNLLSSYYGTTENVSESPASSKSTTSSTFFKPPRSLGLDSTAFDCDRYLKQLLNGTRLPQLLQKQLQISSEVKTLDSDMQMLVYENYNKFISATDTIRTMKNNVDGMDGKMQTLQQVIGSVANRSSGVNSRLHQRHEEMEELSNIRALLVKLHAVFELPQKLRFAQQQGAIEIAAEKYSEVAELLRLYGHKGAFRRVKAEIQAVVNDLTLKVRSRMNANESSDILEDLQLLKKLGESSQTLQEDFLRFYQARLERILSDAEISAKQLTSIQKGKGASLQEGENLTSETLSSFVVNLDQIFVAELAQTAASYSQIFQNESQTRLIQVVKQVFGRYLELLKQTFKQWATHETSQSLASPDLLRSTHNEGDESGYGVEEMTKSLATFITDVSRVQSSLPEVSASDRGAEVLEKSVRFHVTTCFAQLEEESLKKLRESLPLAEKLDIPGSDANVLGGQLVQVSFEVAHLISNGIRSILQALKVYQAQSVVLRSWKDVFVDLVQGQVQHVLMSLLQGFRKLGGIESPNSGLSHCQQSIVLILARITNFLESHTVGMVLELLANIFPGQGNSGGSDQPPPFVGAEVARQLRAGSEDLLRSFVHIEASSLSNQLTHPVQEICGGKGENQEDYNIKNALKSLSHTEAKVRALMSQESTQRSDPRQNLSSLASSGSANRDASQIFSKHHIFEPPSLSPGSIMQSILHYALKSVIEDLRTQSISPEALKQLEEFLSQLKGQLPRHVLGGNANLIHGLIDECSSTIKIRTLEDA